MRLWVLHLAAAGLLIALALGAHGLTRVKIQQAAADAEIINIAGRQRTLSQRVLYVGERYYQFGDVISEAMLIEAADQLSAGNDWLIATAVKSPAAMSLYFGDEQALDARTKAYVRDVRRLAEAPANSPQARQLMNRLADRGETVLWRDLNAAVALFEREAGERNANLQLLQAAITGLFVALIAAEILLIFRPMARSVLASVGRLDFAANHDALTGLVNRKRLFELLDRQIAGADPVRHDLVVINVDLDGFKAVNDTLGHPAGDAVLVHVARLLERHMPDCADGQSPIVARLGGDEFVIALLVDRPSAIERTERLGAALLQAVRQPVDLEIAGGRETCVIGMSLGYAHMAASGPGRDRLVADADIALYESKRAGKTRMTRFEPDMRAAAERRHRLENDLRHAVLNGEFEPHFQVQASMASGAPTGVEMMARWRHPQRGLLAPGDFFDMAVELGVIDMIEGTLLLASIETFVTLRAQGHDLPRLSINMSRETLTRADFADNLAASCAMNGLEPDRISIEMSDAGISDPAHPEVPMALARLSDAGFGVTIDGFGTGASSLPLLSQVNVSELKLAPSLVRNISDIRNARMVAAAVSIARGMGIAISAVGVETQQQVDALRALGCARVQGNIVAPVGPAEQLRDWLTARQTEHVSRIDQGPAGGQRHRL